MLNLQIFHTGQWHDAASLVIPDPARGRNGPAELGYETDYALSWMGRDDEHACSLTLPVELMVSHRAAHWFGFLEDIMPGGAARRFWVEQLGLSRLTPLEQDYALLSRGCIAPVGNLRIKESLPLLPEGTALPQMRFPINDVLERDSDFLQYAQQMGASSGGATGAGGEAPKLLLRCSADSQVWIDTFQDDPTLPDPHYLVKFPRGPRSDIDCDILRAEYHYYQELAALGVGSIETATMRLCEGSRYPSLWLPRFDVEFVEGSLRRYGLESVYSLLGKASGSYLKHGETLRHLVGLLTKQYRVASLGEVLDVSAFAVEWVKRDFLNVLFGNSDNHGRNTALLKKPDGIHLSPIYDFAPMKADPEGIVRTTQWGSPQEEGYRFDWPAIARSLSDLLPPEHLMAELKALAARLEGLRDRLAARGLPASILDMPAMGLGNVDERLKTWQLL